jgi:hypothetical protein
MTTDPDLESELRTLAAAVAPSDGFADRVAAQVKRSPRPAARRRRALVPALAAAALLVAASAAVFLARPAPPPGPTPEGESAAAPGAKSDGAARNPPTVAFSLSALAYVNSKWGFIDRTGKVVIAESVHPEYRRTLETYLANLEPRVETLATPHGFLDPTGSCERLDGFVKLVLFDP